MADMRITPVLLTLLLLVSCTGQTPLRTTPSPAPVPTASPIPASTPPPPFAVIGYLPDYRDANANWGSRLTDIIYFSAEPRADGTLDASRLNENVLGKLHEMQARFGMRLLLSIGGWQRSDGFAAMTSQVGTRSHFVESLAEYIHANKLNGADFDWEFPQDETQFQDYILLLQEVQANFQPKGLLLSVALSPDFEFPLAPFAVVDRIHVMSYDRGPRHSTYTQAVADLNTFVSAGLPKEKLVLGVPFYGREIANTENAYSYADIVEKFHPMPALDEMSGIFFNGIQTIQRKTCYARQNGFGGVMIWELGQDTADSSSLLQAIQRSQCS